MRANPHSTLLRACPIQLSSGQALSLSNGAGSGERTMNLTPFIDQTNGFQNRRTWEVYENMFWTHLFQP